MTLTPSAAVVPSACAVVYLDPDALVPHLSNPQSQSYCIVTAVPNSCAVVAQSVGEAKARCFYTAVVLCVGVFRSRMSDCYGNAALVYE